MDLEFNRNEDFMKQSLGLLRSRFQKISLGGGLKAAEKQKNRQGKDRIPA